ncbi:unnamed protein product [marine sediment metagenome]|uniref:Uncharacterized protein n=1 Tax=marine sediment metagenome TaxID=412755 RepID=X1JRV9_9ZZZZ
MNISKELKEVMVGLRLSGIVATLPDRISYAVSKKLSHEEFLEMIFFDEREKRQARLLNTKMKKAGVDANIPAWS